MLRACLLCAWTLALTATEVEHEIIIVAEPPPVVVVAASSTLPTRPGAEPPMSHRGEAARWMWQHPEQTFVDSNIGPLPLYTESVYDASGMPRPRFPDAFAKTFFDDPTEANALAYLESQRVRVRRYMQASDMMQRVAVTHGYVTPEAFKPAEGQLSNNRALAPPYTYDRESWGVPTLDPQQSRLAGLAREEIPETPGRTSTRYVEVVFLWDHRCQHSMRAYRPFAAVSKEVFERELGPRFLAVSLDNDQVAVQTQLDFLEYLEVPTKNVENWLDQTDLRRTVRVTRTPTYVFIDRRSGRFLRLEGAQDEVALRATLLDLVGHAGEAWDDALAEWFRPVRPGIGADGATEAGGDQAPTVDDATADGADASPVQPPSERYQAWDPDGLSD